jgi:hypothetical protein
MGCNSAPQDIDKGFAGNIVSSFHVQVLIRILVLKKE